MGASKHVVYLSMERETRFVLINFYSSINTYYYFIQKSFLPFVCNPVELLKLIQKFYQSQNKRSMIGHNIVCTDWRSMITVIICLNFKHIVYYTVDYFTNMRI